MTDKDFQNYLNEYNAAVNRYSEKTGISPEEVVDMISAGELVIK